MFICSIQFSSSKSPEIENLNFLVKVLVSPHSFGGLKLK